jgi:transporter family-2 protein
LLGRHRDRDVLFAPRGICFDACSGRGDKQMFSILSAYALALCAGISFVAQQAVNANLRAEIGSAWWAGFASYLGGTIVMLVAALVMREALPTVGMISRSTWLSWMGGVFGAVYIAVSIFLLPRLGAATVIALIVAGQMIGSLAFDHFGVLGLNVHQASPARLAGAVLLMLGAILIRL